MDLIGPSSRPTHFQTVETLRLSPLPCWQHLPEDVWTHRALAMIADIEEQTTAQRSRTGSQPKGASIIRSQHPHDRPARSKRSPAPLVHALSLQVRREFRTAYSCFVGAFRTTAEKLQAGESNALPDYERVRRITWHLVGVAPSGGWPA